MHLSRRQAGPSSSLVALASAALFAASVVGCGVETPVVPGGAAPTSAGGTTSPSTTNTLGNPGPQTSTPPTTPSGLPTFMTCESLPFVPSAAIGFTAANARLRNQVDAPLAQDVLANPGSVAVAGSFTYGRGPMSVSGEPVAVSVDTCAAWVSEGTAMTQNGSSEVSFSRSMIGRFDVAQEMQADASFVLSKLHVVPQGTHAVVFDVDGTLTIDNQQYVYQTLNPNYAVQYFPDADKAAQAWSDKGYLIVYLTGRPLSASAMTKASLASEKLPVGHTHFTETTADAAPTNAGVGQYKADALKALQQLGVKIDFAYGNEATDVFAYTQVGLTPSQIFTLGSGAGMMGTQALPTGFTENLPFIAQQAAAVQPFTR